MMQQLGSQWVLSALADLGTGNRDCHQGSGHSSGCVQTQASKQLKFSPGKIITLIFFGGMFTHMLEVYILHQMIEQKGVGKCLNQAKKETQEIMLMIFF